MVSKHTPNEFEIVGPFPIPYQRQSRGSGKRIHVKEAREFWENPEPCLYKRKNGIYVFSIKAGKGYQPWYIGKAGKNLYQECLGKHQREHYNNVLFKGMKGTPVMFFVVPKGNKNKIPKNMLDDMETFFIQSAIYKNPELSNIQKTKIPNWVINGVIRSPKGRPSPVSISFRKMMGL